jgi:CheY-like chemotaxis protein
MPTRLPSIAGARVLVIEDNEDLRTVFALCLENAGAEVQAADSGAQALRMLASWVPHVIFCDLHMPVMDGWQFLAKMREQVALRALPAIAVTGSAADAASVRARGGFQGHMLKPVSRASLVTQVHEVVGDPSSRKRRA